MVANSPPTVAGDRVEIGIEGRECGDREESKAAGRCERGQPHGSIPWLDPMGPAEDAQKRGVAVDPVVLESGRDMERKGRCQGERQPIVEVHASATPCHAGEGRGEDRDTQGFAALDERRLARPARYRLEPEAGDDEAGHSGADDPVQPKRQTSDDRTQGAARNGRADMYIFLLFAAVSSSLDCRNIPDISGNFAS